MKKANVWKRTIAGLLSLLIVAGYSMPVNPAMTGLFERPAITVQATQRTYSFHELFDDTNYSSIIIYEGDMIQRSNSCTANDIIELPNYDTICLDDDTTAWTADKNYVIRCPLHMMMLR